MGTNHRPEIRETKDAIWRRVKLVPFNVSIPEKEQIGDLPKRLRAEYRGILAWCVRGCLEWQTNGLNPPKAVVDATAEYRAEQDVIAEFLKEECVVSDQLSARATPLHERYKQREGSVAMSQRAFGKAMTERGFVRSTNNGTVYKGLGLRAETSASDKD
jgi:putative DNA primase/helicase